MEADIGKYELVIDPNEIIVNVSNPTQVKTTLSSHTVYTIQGNDLTGTFQIIRRYSDFDHVRQVMIKNWPGCYVPPIPKKKAIGNNQFVFVESRRQGLFQFCKQVSLLKHLWYSSEFQVLIRGKEDVEKSLKELAQQGFKQISIKYQQKFKSLSAKSCQQSQQKRVIDFQQSIKKISALVSSSKQNTRYIFDSYNHNLQQYEVLIKYVFPEYEKHFLSSYVNNATQGKLVFANGNDQKLTEIIQEWKKIADEKKVWEFYLLLEKQQRELQAFQEVLKSRNTYQSLLKQHGIKQKDLLLDQNKLNAGKQSLFKSILKSNIEQQKKTIQISIDLNQQKIKGLTQLCNLMTILMAEYEIPRFEEYKVKKYYETIRTVAEFQIRLENAKEQMCDYLLSNPNLIGIKTQVEG